MTNIDPTQIITSKTVATLRAQARERRIKSACQTAISDVLDENTSRNLLTAAWMGTLTDSQKDMFAQGQAWIQTMQEESRAAIAQNRVPVWPQPPEGLATLTAAF